MSIHCSVCATENLDEAKFCRGCGTRLTLKCESCDGELPPDSRFCHHCGAQVGRPCRARAHRGAEGRDARLRRSGRIDLAATLAPDVRIQVERVDVLTTQGIVGIGVTWGTSDGGAFENRFGFFVVVACDRVVRCEVFAEGDVERFHELAS